MFADIQLTHEIESAECGMMAGFVEAFGGRPGYERAVTLPIGGGVATYAAPQLPFNKVIGLGLDGPIDERDLDAVEAAFAERETPVQIELATVAHNSVARLLTGRGYRLLGFENVLALDLEAWTRRDREGASIADPSIAVDVIGEADGGLWVETVVDGFADPDEQPSGESHESFPRESLARLMEDVARIPGFVRFLARREGAVAGGAGMRVHGRVAQLAGASTSRQHRRRGVQTALLRARLSRAAQQGARVAVITTAPGSKSQQNAQRQGFDLLYARAILVLE